MVCTFSAVSSSIIDKYKLSWVRRWRAGVTVPQCKAGHHVVQFGHFGQGRHGDGALVIATAPLKHKTKKTTSLTHNYSHLEFREAHTTFCIPDKNRIYQKVAFLKFVVT